MNNSNINENKKTSKKDAVFKSIFGKAEDTYLLETLLKDILGEEVKVIEFKERELPIQNFDDRVDTVDMLVKLKDELVHIELNSDFSRSIRFRNFLYFTRAIDNDQEKGEEVKYDKKYISINLSFRVGRKKGLLRTYKFYDKEDEGDDGYLDNVSIKVVNMDLAKIECYNENASDLAKHIAALTMTKRELREYKKEDKFMEKLASELEKMEEENIWADLPDADREQARQEYKEEAYAEVREEIRDEVIEELRIELRGEVQNEVREKLRGEIREETKEKIAINMLSNGSSVGFVSKCTNLSKKDVEKLQKDNNLK